MKHPAVRPLLYCTALAATARLWPFMAPAFAVDDAWISFRVARNLLQHGVLSSNLGQPPVEGMTNLLWTLLSTVWVGLLPSVDPIFGARVVGALAHLGFVVLAAAFAGELAEQVGGRPPWAVAACGALLASDGNLAFHALSGLETPLYLLLAVAAMRSLWSERSATGWGAGALLGLLAFTRPEGVLLGAAGCALGLFFSESRRRARQALAVFAASVAALELFRWSYYGALVPNTFFAKPGQLEEGAQGLLTFVRDGLGWVGVLALFAPWGRARRTWPLVALALLLAAGTVFTGGDWMPGYRRFGVVLALLAVGGATALSALQGRARWAAVAVAAWVVGAHGWATFQRRDAQAFPTGAMFALGRALDALPQVREVALVDLGRFGWGFTRDLYDFAGLTDAHLARQPGLHLRKQWDEAYFRARAPEVLVLNPMHHELWAQVHDSLARAGGYHLALSLPLVEGHPATELWARDGVSLEGLHFEPPP